MEHTHTRTQIYIYNVLKQKEKLVQANTVLLITNEDWRLFLHLVVPQFAKDIVFLVYFARKYPRISV